MTDEQIEQLALKFHPELSSQYESYPKKVRDKYEQKLALIELTRTGDHADDQLAKQIGDLMDCELTKTCNKLIKKLK